MNRLKELRIKSGARQQDIADFLSVAKSTYSYWESGKIQMNYEALLALADYFGCSIDYMLGRIDNPAPLQIETPDTFFSVGRSDEINERIESIIESVSRLDDKVLDAFLVLAFALNKQQEIEAG